MRIIHAKIYPISGPVVEDGFVDTLKGKIVAAGPMEELPKPVSYTHLRAHET